MRSSTDSSTREDHVIVSKLSALEIEDPSLAAHVPSVDPHAVTGSGDLTSAVLGIIKGMVGPAILYLPHGFASAGYLVALPIMALATLMYLHSSRCLLDAWKLESHKNEEQEVMPLQSSSPSSEESHRQQQHTPLSYPELAFRAFGSRGETLVKFGIAAMQSGVCLTYLIFVPHNLRSSVMAMFGLDIALQYWLVVMVLIQIPLSWIRDISHFTITNSIANFLILYSNVTCLGFAVEEATQGDHSEALTNVQSHLSSLKALGPEWFLFIGTSVRTHNVCVMLHLKSSANNTSSPST